MDKREAQEILKRQIEIYRGKDYDQLAELVGSQHIYSVTGKSGAAYQIEVQAFWDRPDQPYGNLRVLMSIDDGKILSSLVPMTTDFILDPDGDFVGE
jgi:hypothetical protein